jgi:RNA polymerase sigma factor (sigma-70 family)
MQEAFVKVWERWDRISSLADPSGYLYRTAFNTSRSRYRKAKRAAKRVFWVAPAADPFADIADREAVISPLARLTPRQRAAVVLTEVEELTSDQAAELLGVRPVTVRSLASQARAAMRRFLEQDDD